MAAIAVWCNGGGVGGGGSGSRRVEMEVVVVEECGLRKKKVFVAHFFHLPVGA